MHFGMLASKELTANGKKEKKKNLPVAMVEMKQSNRKATRRRRLHIAILET
jgi:hypothetical protein